tara:strand:- start:5892 stop:6356 length:465 start_codon:yes stop_codon:yes gene_type:complete
MQINSNDHVSRIYQMNNTSSSAAVSSHSSDTIKNETADKVTLSEAGLNAESKWQEIANKYDPTNMSYDELSRMASDLHLNGLITSQEALAMRAPPSRDFDPDEKYDTVALARQSVEFDQSLGAAQGKDAQLRVSVLNILETIQNLSRSTGHAEN